MARLAATCCNRDITEVPGSVEAGCLQAQGPDARENWQFVGEGKGNYIQAPDYDYVGDGIGSYAPQRIITYRGWKFRRGCVQAAGALAALAILCGVVTVVLWSHRSSETAQVGRQAQGDFGQPATSSPRPTGAPSVATAGPTTGAPSSPAGQVATNAPQPLDGAAAQQVVVPQAVVAPTVPALAAPAVPAPAVPALAAPAVADPAVAAPAVPALASPAVPALAALVGAAPAVAATAELDVQELRKRQAVPVFNCANIEAMTTAKTTYCCESFGKFCDAFQGPPSAVAASTPTAGLTGSCAALGCTDQYNAEWPCQCNPKCDTYSNCCGDHATQCQAGEILAAPAP